MMGAIAPHDPVAIESYQRIMSGTKSGYNKIRDKFFGKTKNKRLPKELQEAIMKKAEQKRYVKGQKRQAAYARCIQNNYYQPN